ncbi:MAG TPA: 30S ribosomal protein S8 [Bacteroidota bacterium]|nr:30S ribosomal protein S8 [Bacteroidota bacterium]
MQTTDPIADYLTRIRNGIHARHKRIDVPASNLKREITRILADKKLIAGYSEIRDNRQGVLRIALKYTEGINAITGLQRISRPGLRIYTQADRLPRVMNGLGLALISTSQGILTDRDARAKKVGGEVLCYIW